MSWRFDTSEVDALAADFTRGPGRVQRGARRVLGRSARRVQAGMRADASGHRYLPELPGTVGRDQVGSLEYEVGFDRRGQGKLANIIVFGSINNAPVFDHTSALRRDVPLLERDAADMAEGAALADD